MHTKRYFLALLAAATLAACTDRQPTNNSIDNGPSLKKDGGGRSALLTNVPVSGVVPGGTFEGVMTVTRFDLSGERDLVASGVLTGTATVAGVATPITQNFTGVPVTMRGHHSRCEIVNLDLGPLHLDVLGLVVDLNEVILDVAGDTGAGNLLGNLLCAVTHLLDGTGALGSILNFLDRINDILAGL